MGQTPKSSSLDSALRQFEAAEANLVKLEQLWPPLREAIPCGIAFGSNPDYDRLCREYRAVLPHLPAIDGFKLSDKLQELNAIAQCRLDWADIGEIAAEAAYEDSLDDPGKDLAEYRFRFNRKRRELIRAEVNALMGRVDAALPRLQAANAGKDRKQGELVQGDDWEAVKEAVDQIEVLLGSGVERPPRWDHLKRHLSFGQAHDLDDIVRHDWPDARSSLGKKLFGASDPVPVEVADLGELVSRRPRGPVATKLKWDSLDEEQFERLVYVLVSTTPGYENAQWLLKTNAPDRGRDLSVERVTADPLAGTTRARVIVQCKHWLSKSVAVPEVATLTAQVKHWEPPVVRTLVIATSGRFTGDAVQLIEQHNDRAQVPRIEMWPESHLETLLAARPDLIAEYNLR